jgi:hypothetical protein
VVGEAVVGGLVACVLAVDRGAVVVGVGLLVDVMATEVVEVEADACAADRTDVVVECAATGVLCPDPPATTAAMMTTNTAGVPIKTTHPRVVTLVRERCPGIGQRRYPRRRFPTAARLLRDPNPLVKRLTGRRRPDRCRLS